MPEIAVGKILGKNRFWVGGVKISYFLGVLVAA